MILTNLTIKDILAEEPKLTFLVGAGCSMDAPSCLPAGYPMMEAIVKYTCAESEVKKILEMEELRFEALVEIVRDALDPNLKIIDFYGLCDKPNVQHFFLAEMIKKGKFVITTNFDFLIEHALLQSELPSDCPGESPLPPARAEQPILFSPEILRCIEAAAQSQLVYLFYYS